MYNGARAIAYYSIVAGGVIVVVFVTRVWTSRFLSRRCSRELLEYCLPIVSPAVSPYPEDGDDDDNDIIIMLENRRRGQATDIKIILQNWIRRGREADERRARKRSGRTAII